MFNRIISRNHCHSQSGITLVELVIFIIVVAIVSMPLSVILKNTLSETVLPEHYTIASSLARKEVENVVNLQFSTITDVAETSYTGNFSQYSYEISVDNVAGDDLNTPVADDSTDYKRVEITIKRSGFPDVAVVTLITNN